MYKSEPLGGSSETVESSGDGSQTGKDQSQERESLHLDAAVGKLLEGKS